jgi:hypothetical protein
MVRTHLAALRRAIAERIEPQDRLAVYMDVRQSLAQTNQRLPADMRALAVDCTLCNHGLANTTDGPQLYPGPNASDRRLTTGRGSAFGRSVAARCGFRIAE